MAKTICVMSAKGGAGKTLIAANLAVSLAKEQQKKVCLIDLDLHIVGDMAKMLGLTPKLAMIDAVNFLKEHSSADLKEEGFLIHSASSEIDFLPGVLKPQDAPNLDPDSIAGIFNLLDPNYDYIIAEAGDSFSDVFVATLSQANLILLVVTPDILAIYQSKWAIEMLESLHFPLKMVRIVLNRAESTSSISWQEVRVSLPQVDIISRVPSEGKIVGQATNRGVPVVIDSPRTKFASAIRKMSSYLVTEEEGLFTKRGDLDDVSFKDSGLEQVGQFWKRQGMVEPIAEILAPGQKEDIINLKRRIYNRLIEDLNLKKMDLKEFSDIKKTKALRNRAEVIITNILLEEAGSFISSADSRKRVIKEILDEALGLGPLEELLADPTINDIMVNNKDEVYVERQGKIELTDKKFMSNDQVRTIIERIIAPLGKRIDESVPMVDSRLADGSRINAIIPPLSLTGPSLTIRKFRKELFNVQDLAGVGTLSLQMGEFLKTCVIGRRNIIISGGTGSGKTTTLNVISEFIPHGERIITIEDAAELKLNQEHWVRLEPRPANVEGKGEITIKELFRNTLRMRPDRIIIGECRGIETLDMLQAMNTGHDGSMTTIHANSTHDVLARLDSMILMSGIELPLRAIHEMIAAAINLIIHTERFSDGSRKISQISEVAGMKDDVHIDLRDIFLFRQTGLDNQGKVLGHFEATGYVPTFVEKLKSRGIFFPPNSFQTP